ncbi:MAG: branched-chain-amino-acid transaminase [Planctomycetota bacterium]|jgi:branched-chain amino acid aminotransferase|nr:branched-chain-amino-acid transaminase [Planctomycetota bacterium]
MSYIWLDGKLVARAEAKVSVFDHGLLYGDGCFEGIRAYNGRILKLKTHLARMFESASLIHLVPAYDLEEIEDAIRETMDANQITDGYIRLVFTRGVGTLGLHPFRCPTPGTFIIADKIQLYPEELYRDGMAIIVAKRPRIPIDCLDPRIKSLNYLNNILAKVEAIEAGVLEAIMLNTEGSVAECTGDNIFAVKGDRIFTPATSTGILHGVTRRFVMREIAPACGLKVEEAVFELDELLNADEVFLTGTAAEVIGVSKIDDTVIGAGKVGPVTARLIGEFRRRIAEGVPED